MTTLNPLRLSHGKLPVSSWSGPPEPLGTTPGPTTGTQATTRGPTTWHQAPLRPSEYNLAELVGQEAACWNLYAGAYLKTEKCDFNSTCCKSHG